jgi:hypothetical protein
MEKNQASLKEKKKFKEKTLIGISRAQRGHKRMA